jgi:hypothetical protein
MGESEIAAFRERFRIDLIKRLALKTALGVPVLARALSIEDSRDSLTAWLNEDAKRVVKAFGKHFQVTSYQDSREGAFAIYLSALMESEWRSGRQCER